MQLLFFAARRFIECCGLEQPTVFVFEDIHWAEPSEIALLGYLGQHVRDSPVMLRRRRASGAARRPPDLGRGPDRADDDPARPAAARRRSGARGPPPRCGGRGARPCRVVETAGGNPLFLEELAASVVERGASGDLPVTVREAIAARIDALPEDARAALLSAAVVGKTFWRGVRRGGRALSTTSTSALAVLEARDFVRRDAPASSPGDAQFTFKHMLIREVAYATVPRASRRERHAAVARYVEETSTGAAETLSTILAHHWREAGEAARAIPYLLAAADAARRGWAQEPSSTSTRPRSSSPTTTRQGASFGCSAGVALVELADYARASEELSELVPELEGQEKLEAMIALGHALVWTERHEEAIARASEARRLVEELGRHDRLAGGPRHGEPEPRDAGRQGRSRACPRARRSRARAVGATRAAARSHAAPAPPCGHHVLDRPVRAGRPSSRSETRALAHEEHRAESLLRGGGFEALALAGLGRHEEAIAIWDDMLLLARELGQSPRVLLNYSSLAYRELYDLDEARSRTERGARAVRRPGVRHADAVRRVGPALHAPPDGRRRRCAGDVARALGGR